MTTLPPIACPGCAASLSPRAGLRGAAHRFDDCLRRCDHCGIGFSNGVARPTRILRDPMAGVPDEVRPGLSDAIDRALHIDGREEKRTRLGFTTSEDALTWTVFAYLLRHAPAALRAFGRSWLGCAAVDDPAVLLWGALLTSETSENLRDALIGVLDALGERRHARSEPDVVLDFGVAGVILIEVKLGATNAVLDPRSRRYERYLGPDAFSDPGLARQSGLYQLVRNWRIGCDLAMDRPFRLVNLGPPDLSDTADPLTDLERGLRTSERRQFVRHTWPELLNALEPFPPWLDRWLRERGLLVRDHAAS